MFLASSVFTTLFSGPAPEFYGSMSTSMRTMFDYMLANYNHIDMSRSDTSHSLLLIVHLIISNIFLLNFLVAILSSVYSIMKIVGEFDFKANMYSYIEKFQTAHLDTKGLDEFVVHPCPINLLTIGLLPFHLREKASKTVNFSKLMFWLENVIMMVLFLVYLIVLMPVIYFKMIYHLFKATRFRSFLWVSVIWILLGFFVLLFYVFKDLLYFIKICCDYGDSEPKDMKKLNVQEKENKIVIYNEVIGVMTSVFM